MHINLSTGIVVSRGNSTVASLGANAAWTGITEIVNQFEEITINLAGAPSVAPGRLYFEFSPDGTHWDISVPVSGTDLAGPMSMPPQPLRVVLPYFRIRYENGATVLTELRITTVFHRSASKQLTRYLNQDIDDTEGIENVRSVIAIKADDGSYSNVSSTDPLPILSKQPDTGDTTSVTSSTSNQVILAANAERIGATIFNESTAILYIKLGETASNTSYTLQLGPSAYYEVPFGYTGQIDGLWVSDNGFARVSELT